jgi:PAS domain S-box-containing protein
LLRYLGECLNATRTVKEFWGRVLEGLKHNDYDVPFALLYSVADSDDSTPDSQCSDGTPVATKTCVLEGSIGVPPGHPISPHQFDTKESDRPLIPAFSEAIQTLKPSMLHTNNDTLPKSLLEGIEWRGYEDSCRQAMVLPLRPTNADKVCALLLLGINPRRAYDQEYITFTAMLNRQISTSLASVLLFEDEVRQSKHAAEELSQQLQLQTSRMRRMTELSPLGMYLFDSKGRLLEGNERYFEMTGHPRDKNDEFSFTGLFEYKSQQDALDMWHDMMTTHKPSTRELQLRNPKAEPRDLNGEHIEYWVLASSQPEMSPDGEVISIMGSIADISQIKWAQGLQEQRLREAEESKRQQNEFIDITSHEMRNPLSAILICADDIRDTLTDHKFSDGDLKMARECIEAANNIALCVQHQKAIVDDILTVSKLDSHLLSIIPVPAQPVIIIQRAMAMFRPEVQAKGINMKYHPHDSLAELEIDWVMLDPTRLLQIAVNLITNAIKFTQNSPNRVITIHICAHADQPDFDVPKEFGFVPPRHAVVDFANGEGWGSGQLIYLRTEVHDTGVGLSTQEKTLLFEKFAQASPRTHVQYGGSGL